MNSHIITAIIVTYNPLKETFIRQINALINEVNYIVFIDNNSKNIHELQNEIENSFNQFWNNKIFLIKNNENFGIGKSQNIGIDFAISLKSTEVLILDHDSIIDKDFCINLLTDRQILESLGHKIGAIGPIYYNEKTGEIYPISKYIGPFIERIIPINKPIEASFLIASGSLISLDVIKNVGYMNESFFIDYVDVEWSFRAKSIGYSVFSSPTSKMKHTIGDERRSIFGRSISVHSPLRRYYLYRNSIYMIKDSKIHLGYKVREISFNALRFVLFLILSNERIKYFKYSVSGFVDGVKGVKGKCPHFYN
jgi:rhamnosyltransferase